MDIRNTFAKYECPDSCSKKVIVNVQKLVKGHGQGHTSKFMLPLEKLGHKEHICQIWKPYLLG